jgi:hypothetical protein
MENCHAELLGRMWCAVNNLKHVGYEVLTVVIYEEFCHLGYNFVQSVESQLTFWRNMLPPSLRSKNNSSKKPA